MYQKISKWLNNNSKLIFVSPAVITVLLLMVFPIIYNIYLSFHRCFLGLPGVFIGLDNYINLFTPDPRFLNSIIVTIKFVIPSVLLSTILGMILALILNREFIGKGFFRTIFILPMLIAPTAVGVVWMIMYNPTLGVMNYFLSLFGLEPRLWVNSTSEVILALALIEVWKWTPLSMIIILAALQALPVSPFEAAKIDGVNEWQSFRYITLPLIKPAVIIAILLRTMDCLKSFDTIYVMTQGGPDIAPETLEIYTFKIGFKYFEIGYSSAIALVLTIIILLVSWVLLKARKKSWNY